jgi:predicted enzyme related to lactoylglutathione lyase
MLEKRIRDDVNHTIVFFEIPADDVAKMKDFYKAVFDWKVIDIPGQDMEYTIFTQFRPTRTAC